MISLSETIGRVPWRNARAGQWIPLWGLLLVGFVFVGCQTPPPQAAPPARPTSASWEKEIAAFESEDRTNPPPRDAILFIGSSSMRMWKSLAKDFPGHRVINRGFGGSQLVDSVYYADRVVIPYRPRQIILYAGGNDINAGKTPQQVFDDFQSFVRVVRAKLPQTQIAYVSVAPNPARWKEIERVRETNRLIADYVRGKKGLSYIDVHSQMLGPDGQPKPDIYLDDRLHMNAKGYGIWTEVIGPRLNPEAKRP